MSRLLVGLASAVLLVAGGSAGSQAQDAADAGALRARGRGLVVFSERCASCHGRSGHGDGSAASHLPVRPADLTRLAEQNGGVFPAAAVTRAIEGADRAHRGSGMPLWGEVFRADPATPAAAVVKEQIDALTLYLEFIQRRRPR